MKRFVTIFLTLLLVLGYSCGNRSTDPDDKLPGRTVVENNDDGTPKHVVYYKVDDKGKMTDEVVREIHYYPGKKKYIDGGFNHGKRDGEWFAYFESGKVQTQAYYIDGKEHGDYIVFRDNGTMIYKGHYNMGICDGVWHEYNDQGEETKTIVADENTMACQGCAKCRALRQQNKQL